MNIRLLGSLLFGAVLLAACSPNPAHNANTVATQGTTHCESDAVTGSLVEKQTTCSDDDDNRNSVMDTMQGSNRPHGGSGGH